MENSGESDVDEELDDEWELYLCGWSSWRNARAQQAPFHCQQVENHSFPVFLSPLFCLAFHVSFIFTNTIMGQLRWARRDVVKFQYCKFCFVPKYIFIRIASLAREEQPNTPPDHTFKFLDKYIPHLRNNGGSRNVWGYKIYTGDLIVLLQIVTRPPVFSHVSTWSMSNFRPFDPASMSAFIRISPTAWRPFRNQDKHSCSRINQARWCLISILSLARHCGVRYRIISCI